MLPRLLPGIDTGESKSTTVACALYSSEDQASPVDTLSVAAKTSFTPTIYFAAPKN